MLTDFSFRGNHIGDPAEEVIKRMFREEEVPKPGDPGFIGSKDPQLADIDYKVKVSSVIDNRNRCLQFLHDKGESACTDYEPTFLGFYHTYLTYQFLDKKLSGFNLTFPLRAYFKIEPMLTGKYGPPHQTEVNKVYNNMGAEFEQLVAIWNTTHGPLKLYFRYPSLDKGMLILEDEAAKQEADARKAKELEAKGKTTF
jgi:hypothetical protein